MLLKGFGTGVRPIADSAPMGRRSRRASWLRWDRSRASLVNLLLMLRRIINKGFSRGRKKVTNMYEDCFTLANASTDPTKVEGSPRGKLNMVDELLSWHIPMITRTLGVGADGHSIKVDAEEA